MSTITRPVRPDQSVPVPAARRPVAGPACPLPPRPCPDTPPATGDGVGRAPDTSHPTPDTGPPTPPVPPKGRASALYILPVVYFSPVFDRTSGPPAAGRGSVRFVRFGHDRTNLPSPLFAGPPCCSGTCSVSAGWQGGAYQSPGIGCQCPHLGTGFVVVCQLFVRCHSAPKGGEFFLPISGYW